MARVGEVCRALDTAPSVIPAGAVGRSTASATALGLGLAVLDDLRAWGLRVGVHALGGRGRALIRQPVLRVVVFGSLSIALALLMVCTVPLILLAVSPLLLGVPHLVADVRYLVVQPGYHRRLWLALPVAAVLLGAASGLGMRAGLSAMAVTLLLASRRAHDSRWRSLLRRALGLSVVGGLAYLGLRSDFFTISISAWRMVTTSSLWGLPRCGCRGDRLRGSALVAGPAGGAVRRGGGPSGCRVLSASPAALSLFDEDPQLGLDGARWLLAPICRRNWVRASSCFFAFAQAVHYGVCCAFCRTWPASATRREVFPAAWPPAGQLSDRRCLGSACSSFWPAALCADRSGRGPRSLLPHRDVSRPPGALRPCPRLGRRSAAPGSSAPPRSVAAAPSPTGARRWRAGCRARAPSTASFRRRLGRRASFCSPTGSACRACSLATRSATSSGQTAPLRHIP